MPVGPTIFKFNFGDEVQDVTKFKGIVTARTEWMNGCIRYQLERVLPDGNVAEFWVDEERLTLVKPAKKTSADGRRKTGGGRPAPRRVGG